MKNKFYVIILFMLINLDAFSQLERYDWELAKDTLRPKDLHNFTLIAEVYNYSEFLDARSTECYKQNDSKRNQKEFKKYEKSKFDLLENYDHKYIYLNTDSIDSLDINEFRYVLKSKMKILTPITYLPSGECNGWVASYGYYIYDRKINKSYPIIATMKLRKLDIGEALNE